MVMIIRKIDPVGRIVLPKEIRDKLGMEVNSEIAINQKGNKIELYKYEESCCICGEEYDNGEVNGNKICNKCFKKIKSI